MYYTEKEKQIPIAEETDVIIVGAGPAGTAAALAAARLNAKTLLIESAGCLGGVATSGLMSHFTGTVDSKLYKEILQRSNQRNKHVSSAPNDIWIDPEQLKTLYIEMLSEAGARFRLYTLVCDTIREGNSLKGVITESKSGREAFLGKVIIDASGDGDIAAKAGVRFTQGREEDGKMQPVTLMFKVAGVDYSRAVFLHSFESDIETPFGSLQALAKEKIPYPAGHVLLYPSTLPGVVTCNMTNCTDIDGLNAESLTEGESVCRSQLNPIVDFLREYVAGYENCYLISSASLIGVRETRHLEGMYTITREDIYEAKQFDDWVVRGAYFNFDVHNLDGPGLDKTGMQKHFKQKSTYTIPYGCLLPREINGLLFAGRNISGTHLAHSNYRVMPICVAMGEAAGTAAALAVKKGCEPRELKAEDIQALL